MFFIGQNERFKKKYTIFIFIKLNYELTCRFLGRFLSSIITLSKHNITYLKLLKLGIKDTYNIVCCVPVCIKYLSKYQGIL